MSSIILILLTASIIMSFIAIISFFMTGDHKKNNSKASSHHRGKKHKKHKKRRPPSIHIHNYGSEGDRDVRITKRGTCIYPPDAKRKGIETVMYIDVHIDENGKISEFQIPHKTKHGFEEASCKYIKQWSFKPAIQDGEPVDSWVRVPIKFALKKEYR